MVQSREGPPKSSLGCEVESFGTMKRTSPVVKETLFLEAIAFNLLSLPIFSLNLDDIFNKFGCLIIRKAKLKECRKVFWFSQRTN